MANRKKSKKRKPAKKQLPDVNFDFSGPEERNARIEVIGCKPFSIRFQVPDGNTRLDAHVAGTVQAAAATQLAVIKAGESGKDTFSGLDLLQGSGDAMVRFILAHLKTWTLAPAVERESLLALAKGNVEAVSVIFHTISNAGGESKN